MLEYRRGRYLSRLKGLRASRMYVACIRDLPHTLHASVAQKSVALVHPSKWPFWLRASVPNTTQACIRRALGNCFSVRIYYEILMSKCRGDCDLGLCTFWVLAFINLLSNGKIWFFLRAKRVFFRNSLFLSGSPFASIRKVHRPRSQSPLQSDIKDL